MSGEQFEAKASEMQIFSSSKTVNLGTTFVFEQKNPLKISN